MSESAHHDSHGVIPVWVSLFAIRMCSPILAYLEKWLVGEDKKKHYCGEECPVTVFMIFYEGGKKEQSYNPCPWEKEYL